MYTTMYSDLPTAPNLSSHQIWTVAPHGQQSVHSSCRASSERSDAAVRFSCRREVPVGGRGGRKREGMKKEGGKRRKGGRERREDDRVAVERERVDRIEEKKKPGKRKVQKT